MRYYFIRFKSANSRKYFCDSNNDNRSIASLLPREGYFVGRVNDSGNVTHIDIAGDGKFKDPSLFNLLLGLFITEDELSRHFHKIEAPYEYVMAATGHAESLEAGEWGILSAADLYEKHLLKEAKRKELNKLANQAEDLLSQLASVNTKIETIKKEIGE